MPPLLQLRAGSVPRRKGRPLLGWNRVVLRLRCITGQDNREGTWKWGMEEVAADEGDKERQSAWFCFPWALTGCDPWNVAIPWLCVVSDEGRVRTWQACVKQDPLGCWDNNLHFQTSQTSRLYSLYYTECGLCAMAWNPATWCYLLPSDQ